MAERTKRIGGQCNQIAKWHPHYEDAIFSTMLHCNNIVLILTSNSLNFDGINYFASFFLLFIAKSAIIEAKNVASIPVLDSSPVLTPLLPF